LTQPILPPNALITLQDTGDLIPSLLFAPNVGSDLSDIERRIMSWMSMRLLESNTRNHVQLSEQYYNGLNIVPSLGISTPPELEPLRAILGWCRTAVEARSERLNVQGFRMPNATTIDSAVQEIWQHNNLDAEAPLLHEQAMVSGWTYAIVGKNDNDGDDSSGIPVITTESALNMTASWNPMRREISAAYQIYMDLDPTSDTYGRQLATLYTRDATIQLNTTPNGWIVADRNDHQQHWVPVVQFTPRPQFHERLRGQSEMNAAWRNTQDRAARTLVRMEIAGEFFATAKVYVLGVSEEAFMKKDGTKASAWETYIGRISTIEADANGNLPTVQRIAGESPDGFISSLNQERSIFCGISGLAPQYLGIFSDGNPASADAIRMSDFRLATIAERLAKPYGNDWEKLMSMALKMAGEWTASADQMETDWGPFGIPTPSADTVNVVSMVGAGMVAPDSDDALAALGWSPVQRARIREGMKRQQGLAQIGQAIAGLKPPATPGAAPPQALDGQQPGALQALNSQRTTDSATAG